MKQAKPNVYLLEPGKFVNIYAIVRKNGVLLIDTGTPGKADKILRELAGINVKPSDVKAIVITHAHPDHAGSCTALMKKTHAKLYIHKDDLNMLLGKAPPREPRDLLEKIVAFMSKHFFKYPPPEDAVLLNENSSIQGFEDLKVIHTPGHTPGSLSILDVKNTTLFCGDAINNRAGKLIGPHKHFTFNRKQAWRSVAKIGALSFDTLCPGHGPWIEDGAQKKVKKLLVANEHYRNKYKGRKKQ